MKNDFEFIKDKIEQSGVNAPAHMDTDYVLQTLDGVQPETSADPKIVEFKPKKPSYKLISGLAAAFVAVVALSVFGVLHFGRNIPSPQPSITAPNVKADIPLKTFSSYDEVRDQIKEVARYRFSGYYDMNEEISADGKAVSDDAAAGSSNGSSGGSTGGSSGDSYGASAGSDSYSETYRQVAGVDEADIVKTDGRYLYIVEQDEFPCVRIYSATDEPELITTLNPMAYEDPTATPDEIDPDDYDYEYGAGVNEIYLYNGRLIAVGYEFYDRETHYEYNTLALIYDISDIGNITLVDQFHQSGAYSESRMIGDTLYMVSEEYVYDSDDFTIPVCYDGTEEREIPIDCVCSVENPSQNNMLIIGGFDLGDSDEDIQTSAIIGSVEGVYCNEDNMFIYVTRWNYGYYVDYDDDSGFFSDIAPQKSDPISTEIYKVRLSGGISFTAYGKVEGWLDSRYSLDEKDGYLRVASTLEDEDYNQSNALYILDGDLNQVGSVTGFAEDESIRAVRYVGDTAYVITYEQTDPLFVIDVSDPTAPAILGEVKIDGFSSMLVPIDENTVLGLGYYTEDADYTDMQVQRGFKLALFDVSDKMNPKVLDEKIYRNYYSSVMYEPRALVFNPDRGDYLIPLNLEDYHLDSIIDYYMPDIRGGALNFKVENGKLVELNLYEIDSDNSDAVTVDRCLYVGDRIFMISQADLYYTGEYTYDDDIAVYSAKY